MNLYQASVAERRDRDPVVHALVDTVGAPRLVDLVRQRINQLDEQLRARADRLPVLDLGAMLELRLVGEGEARALELVDAWVTAEDGLLAVDAWVR